MKKYLLRLLLLINITALCGGFDNLGIHSRPVSLGGAFVGIADASYTVFYNPAGLSILRKAEITTTYSNLFPGVEDDNIHYLAASAAVEHPVYGSLGVGGTFLKTNMWQENTLVFSYSHLIIGKFSIGGSAKLLRWSATAAPGEAALSYLGFSFDAGALYVLENVANQGDIRFGVAVHDITQPSIAKNSSKDAALPMKLMAGISYYSPAYEYMLAIDGIKEDDVYQVRAGAEFLVLKPKILNTETGFTVRLGYNTIINNISKKQTSLNGGFGVSVNKFFVDYAYVYNFVMQSIGGSHKFSLGYQF